MPSLYSHLHPTTTQCWCAKVGPPTSNWDNWEAISAASGLRVKASVPNAVNLSFSYVLSCLLCSLTSAHFLHTDIHLRVFLPRHVWYTEVLKTDLGKTRMASASEGKPRYNIPPGEWESISNTSWSSLCCQCHCVVMAIHPFNTGRCFAYQLHKLPYVCH